MGNMTAYKQLGRLNEPVVFEVSEGPEPGPVETVVNRDTIAPIEKGLPPAKVLALACLLVIGGYWGLRRILE